MNHERHSRRRIVHAVVTVIAGIALHGYAASSSAQAQRADDYPAKPIRMIVPFAPGGPPDVIGRPIIQKLTEVLGQPVLFDNRPGAAGMIGSEAVAKSPRDGYTLLYTTGSHNTNYLM